MALGDTWSTVQSKEKKTGVAGRRGRNQPAMSTQNRKNIISTPNISAERDASANSAGWVATRERGKSRGTYLRSTVVWETEVSIASTRDGWGSGEYRRACRGAGLEDGDRRGVSGKKVTVGDIGRVSRIRPGRQRRWGIWRDCVGSGLAAVTVEVVGEDSNKGNIESVGEQPGRRHIPSGCSRRGPDRTSR